MAGTFYICSDAPDLDEASVRHELACRRADSVDEVVIDPLPADAPLRRRRGLVRLTESLGRGDRLIAARLVSLGPSAKEILFVLYKLTRRGAAVCLLDFPSVDLTSDAAKVHRAVLASLVTLKDDERFLSHPPTRPN